ncbi:MAG: hypothetical protein V7K47_23740 [Nostoc sp.]
MLGIVAEEAVVWMQTHVFSLLTDSNGCVIWRLSQQRSPFKPKPKTSELRIASASLYCDY